MTERVPLTHEEVNGWRGLCHEVVGSTVALEADLDFTLAMGHGSTISAVVRLNEVVFPKISLDVGTRRA